MESKLRDKKVLAAIGAAVQLYLGQEREAQPEVSLGFQPVGLWAQFGRQEQMNQRVWCQLRMLGR